MFGSERSHSLLGDLRKKKKRRRRRRGRRKRSQGTGAREHRPLWNMVRKQSGTAVVTVAGMGRPGKDRAEEC